MVSITERKREIGVLRGSVAVRFQVRKAIILEPSASALSLSFSAWYGGILGYYMLGPFSASVNGWVFPYVYPTALAMALFPGWCSCRWSRPGTVVSSPPHPDRGGPRL